MDYSKITKDGLVSMINALEGVKVTNRARKDTLVAIYEERMTKLYGEQEKFSGDCDRRDRDSANNKVLILISCISIAVLTIIGVNLY